ncbi:Small integral membrane protein 1 [Merluccius polli]|uniref:Small integral membrane protein 1 n=1 Tax=Merluccius polli TaxID=89951 RepID=A0AA47MVF4_MERPO|nr:Small integral membrane protein 1 [Merluccius polli]
MDAGTSDSAQYNRWNEDNINVNVAASQTGLAGGMWVQTDVGADGCGCRRMWVQRDVGADGCGCIGMWVQTDVGADRMWVQTDVGADGCECRRMWVQTDVGADGCGCRGMWVQTDVGARMWYNTMCTGSRGLVLKVAGGVAALLTAFFLGYTTGYYVHNC